MIIGDAIDISGFVANYENFQSSTLDVSNSAGDGLTYHLNNTAPNTSFSISSDGSGGTLLTLSKQTPPVITIGQISPSITNGSVWITVTINIANPDSEPFTTTLAASIPANGSTATTNVDVPAGATSVTTTFAFPPGTHLIVGAIPLNITATSPYNTDKSFTTLNASFLDALNAKGLPYTYQNVVDVAYTQAGPLPTTDSPNQFINNALNVVVGAREAVPGASND